MTSHEEDLSRISRALALKIFEEAEAKRIFKEALNEWLDNKFLQFGKWSFMGLVAAGFGGLVIFVMWTQGYHK